MSDIVKLIPAQPGWRIVSVWAGGGDRPKFDYEPIAAWAELEDRPGELVPVRRDGMCEPGLLPLDANDLTFLAILAPGELVDHTSLNWKARIGLLLERQAQEDQRDVKALAVVKAQEPVAAYSALAREADRLIEERLATSDRVSDGWLWRVLQERHPEEASDRIGEVVQAAFASRRQAEVSGDPAALVEHAAELERYAGNKTGEDRTEGNGR